MRYFEGLRQNNRLFHCVAHTKEKKNAMACTLETHIQPGIEIIYVTDGKFDLHINGTTETIREGEIGIIFPFQPHGYERYEGDEYVRFDFDTSLAGDFFNAKQDRIGKKSVFKASEVTKFTIKENFIKETNESKLSAQNLLYSILNDFSSQVELVPVKKDNNVLVKAIMYIRSNMEKDLEMDGVAKALGYSYSYFSRAINKIAGFGFNALLAMIRIEKAKRLLRETTKTILEIVIECGFGSERSFYRQFKDMAGVSPLRYRSNT